MGHFYGTTGYWFYNGEFFDLEDRHINFFLKYPEKLGFTKNEKEMLCLANDLSADTVFCEELSQARNDILVEVLKRGAIRIRFYQNGTSVQCGDCHDESNMRQLKDCIAKGWKKCFGNFVNVMDTNGWCNMVSDVGYGTAVEEFVK